MRRSPPCGPDDAARLRHMLAAAEHAMRFVHGRARSDLDSDDMLRRALINAIQDIGEAAARTSDDGRARVGGVKWGQVVEMRNVLVHVYWGVDLDQVWNTATMDLPPFAAALRGALEP